MWCCCFGNYGSNEERTQLTSGTKYGSSSNAPASGSCTVPSSSHQPPNKSAKVPAKKRDHSSIAYLVMRPVKVPSVDKRFQDHAMLFNGYVDQYDELSKVLVELIQFNEGLMDSLEVAIQHATQSSNGFTRFKSAGPIDISCNRIRKLSEKSKSVSLKKSHRHCVQIVYDGKDVPYEVIPAFLVFNSAGQLVRDLLDKAPTLCGALQLVLDNCKDLRRDIVVACLGFDERESLQNCVDNVAMLELAIPRVHEMEKNTREVFNQLNSLTIGI